MVVTIITKNSVLLKQDNVKRVYHRRGALHIVLVETEEIISFSDETVKEYSVDMESAS